MTPEEVDALKMADLKAKCKELGLNATGLKADLVARIKEALAGGAAPAEAGTSGAEEEAQQGAEEPSAAEALVAAVAAQPANNGKHAPITFDESLAKTATTVKVEIVGAKPKEEPAEGDAPAASAEDKLKARSERFQNPDVSKMKERAERFGVVTSTKAKEIMDKEKLLQRAERFKDAAGTGNTKIAAALEEERRKKRMERFGVVDEETKKKQRAEKFKPLAGDKPEPAKGISTANAAGDADFESKKAARLARFQLPS